MFPKFILYFLPFLPFLTRGILCYRFRTKMTISLRNQELDKESHRTYILAMAGFSFSGLLAMVVLDVSLPQDFHFAVYYLLISFLSYIVSLNLQGYKALRWQDQLATAFMDSASLCLILSVLSILYSQNFVKSFAYTLTIIAISIWLIDHVIRLRIWWKFLKFNKKELNKNEKQ